jgi:hypothetical protein
MSAFQLSLISHGIRKQLGNVLAIKLHEEMSTSLSTRIKSGTPNLSNGFCICGQDPYNNCRSSNTDPLFSVNSTWPKL